MSAAKKIIPAPLPAPLLWSHFIQTMGREPSEPSELQEYTFLNLIDGQKQCITHIEAYLIFKQYSSDDHKLKLLEQKYNSSISLFIIAKRATASMMPGSFQITSFFHCVPKRLFSLSNTMDDSRCLFPYPQLTYLYHQQTEEGISYSLKHGQNIVLTNKATCTASHPLHHTSADELYAKHPNYFNANCQQIGFQCDFCRASYFATYAWHCALCQYDLCTACYKARSVAPGKAPMAPRASQYDKLEPSSEYRPFWVPPMTPNMVKRTAFMSMQDAINEYEDKFIYNNLLQYARYNQDIYDKLHVFNAKKVHCGLPKASQSLRGSTDVRFLSKTIDNIELETTREKLEIISIDTQKQCPFTVCYKIDHDLKENENDAIILHYKLKHGLNAYQDKYDTVDIYDRPMTDKAGNFGSRKWSVKGIIDPDKHLATLQHSSDLATLQYEEAKINTMSDCISWYHWIPSVFRVNKTLTKCDLLSEIPNMDPYESRNTLYPLLTQLFLSFVKQFEHITSMNLRGFDVQCVVKVQDYIINDIKEEDESDSYFGNFHKEGLYEDIAAVGLYYYDISQDIKGGDLVLTVIKRKESHDGFHHRPSVTEMESLPISVSEGTQLVFNNYKCFHRVDRLFGSGNRKIIAFHLINPGNRLISAKNIIVNWKYHAIHFIKHYCRILLNTDSVEFICGITLLFVIGDKRYIESSTEIHNECRRYFFKQESRTELLAMRAARGGLATRAARGGPPIPPPYAYPGGAPIPYGAPLPGAPPPYPYGVPYPWPIPGGAPHPGLPPAPAPVPMRFAGGPFVGPPALD